MAQKKSGTVRYLSRPEVAERIGVRAETLVRYRLPEPDAQIGIRQVGWLPETIDLWNDVRAGRRWTWREKDDPQYVSRAELDAAAREVRRSTRQE